MRGSRGTLRWIAGGVGLAVAAATVIGATPAYAATVGAQLTLSGVASSSNPTGGSTVGVHPGDSVTLTASALPTAGAPAGLNSLLSGLVGGLTGFDVTLQSGNLPGVKYPYVLSSTGCSGTHKSLSLPSLKKGTYKFTYTADKVTVLPSVLGVLGGCKYNQIELSGDQLKKATANQIAVNAKSTYAGQIVVATDPPKGGISIQLPSVSVKPKVGPVQLPNVTVPGITTPTIPTTIPSITVPKLPTKPGTGSGGTKSGSTSSGLNITQPGLSVPEQVVPQGGGDGVYGANNDTGVLPDTGLGNFAPLGDSGGTTPKAGTTAKGSPASSAAKSKTVDLAASTKPASSGSELPIILAILAIIALSLVAATYSRLYLLRRNAA
jgi:hypothetical protein